MSAVKELMDSEVSRREFLYRLGLAALAVSGLASLYSALSGHKRTGWLMADGSGGFGSGSYGEPAAKTGFQGSRRRPRL